VRIYATHDQEGNIVGLAIPAEGINEDDFEVVADPGCLVSKIDYEDTDDSGRDRLLSDLVRNYRVDRSRGAARFIERRDRPRDRAGS
jgi:hypothetical protein